MTVESGYAIAIATLSGWLKKIAPVFQSIGSLSKHDVDKSENVI